MRQFEIAEKQRESPHEVAMYRRFADFRETLRRLQDGLTVRQRERVYKSGLNRFFLILSSLMAES